MGSTANMIIQDVVRQMYAPLENSAYFVDGDSIDLNPDQAINKTQTNIDPNLRRHIDGLVGR